jgi:hypothetical protein
MNLVFAAAQLVRVVALVHLHFNHSFGVGAASPESSAIYS